MIYLKVDGGRFGSSKIKGLVNLSNHVELMGLTEDCESFGYFEYCIRLNITGLASLSAHEGCKLFQYISVTKKLCLWRTNFFLIKHICHWNFIGLRIAKFILDKVNLLLKFYMLRRSQFILDETFVTKCLQVSLLVNCFGQSTFLFTKISWTCVRVNLFWIKYICH